MTRKLCVPVLICLIFSSFAIVGGAQSSASPDTKIRGIVKEIQFNYQGYFFSGTYKLTAFISVLINETIIKPNTFTHDIDQLVGVSYNYSALPNARVNDTVEIFGLWIPVLDLPMSQTIQVGDNVVGSFVDVLSPQTSPPPSGIGSQGVTSIDVGREYSNGSIPVYSEGQITSELWYDWVNINGTQVVFFAYYSKAVNSPVITFLGQHYKADNETEVFMANTLMLLEVYNDTNGNGIPDFTGAHTELLYNFIMNSSVGFLVTPIQKLLVDDVAHYTWGIKYVSIDGFLLYPEDRVIDNITTNTGARAIISHIGFSYDYYIQGNVSYLKTSFDIGNITELQPSWPYQNVTLNGLSLSLFYGTATLSTKPYTVMVNGQLYNSTVIQEPSVSTNKTEVKILDKKAYEFLFGQSYILFRDSGPENCQSKSAASSKGSVPSSPRVSLTWVFSNLQTVLRDLFPKITSLPPEINLDYQSSTLLYRICYPVWAGYRIKHDPTYVAYFYPNKGLSNLPVTLPVESFIIISIIGATILAAALLELRKAKRIFGTYPVFQICAR